MTNQTKFGNPGAWYGDTLLKRARPLRGAKKKITARKRDLSIMRNELKELIERLKNAKKTDLQAQRNSEAARRGAGRQSYRTRTECFCRND